MRVRREHLPDPGKDIGRRLVACLEQRDNLFAELAIGHNAAVVLVVSRVQEHREEVAPVLAAPAAFGDDLGEAPLDLPQCIAESEVGRDREPDEKANQPVRTIGEALHHRFHRGGESGRPARDVNAEGF